MEVRAVRRTYEPPPIEKVVVELTVGEAHTFVNGVKLTGYLHTDWSFAYVARMIDNALTTS